jgi:hypothetical protein
MYDGIFAEYSNPQHLSRHPNEDAENPHPQLHRWTSSTAPIEQLYDLAENNRSANERQPNTNHGASNSKCADSYTVNFNSRSFNIDTCCH